MIYACLDAFWGKCYSANWSYGVDCSRFWHSRNMNVEMNVLCYGVDCSRFWNSRIMNVEINVLK